MKPQGTAAATLSDALDAIYALRREQFRNPAKVRISEDLLRSFIEEVGLPKDEDGEPSGLVGPMTLYGVPVELDDSLGDRIVVE